jgi:cytosine/adenosine deaminase-related metal-dependent hydrolase
MRFAGVDLATAIDMASLWPARLIGLNHPGLEVGAPANLFVFDLPPGSEQALQIRETYHA